MDDYSKALDAAYDVVNALGKVPSTEADKEYCRGIDDVLCAIEFIKIDRGMKDTEAKLKKLVDKFAAPTTGYRPRKRPADHAEPAPKFARESASSRGRIACGRR